MTCWLIDVDNYKMKPSISRHSSSRQLPTEVLISVVADRFQTFYLFDNPPCDRTVAEARQELRRDGYYRHPYVSEGVRRYSCCHGA